MAGMTLAEAPRWLLSDYVIRQHERVAIGKLAQTGDTLRFRRQGDQLRFYEASRTILGNRWQARIILRVVVWADPQEIS
jgi:hypothetical protein